MEAKDEERRLTSILSLDVVEYSRLMGIDEVETLSALKTHRKDALIFHQKYQFDPRYIEARN